MKTTYYLLKSKGELSIYMVSELEHPPLMNLGILDVWVSQQYKEFILPLGCAEIFVRMPPKKFLLTTHKKGVEVLESFEIGLYGSAKHQGAHGWSAGAIPTPLWLEEFTQRFDEKIERFLYVGDKTFYTHLVPINELPQDTYIEKFESVDPLTNPVFFKPDKDRILVTGCFDLFHAGHLHFLSEVYHEYVGEDKELHVGLPDDTSYAALKGRRPIYTFQERHRILSALQLIHTVHEFQIWRDTPLGTVGVEDGHRQLLDEVKPVLFVDSAQKPKERIGIMPYLKERGIPISYVNSIDLHVSDILKRINQ